MAFRQRPFQQSNPERAIEKTSSTYRRTQNRHNIASEFFITCSVRPRETRRRLRSFKDDEARTDAINPESSPERCSALSENLTFPRKDDRRPFETI